MYDPVCPTSLSSTGQNPDYKAIFNRRSNAYHQAMSQFPVARNQEFLNVISLADLQQGQMVCDVPSDGGYLRGYLSCEDHEVIALEASESFYQYCKANGKCRATLTELDNIDLPDASIDCVISLAGLHHLNGRRALFREAPSCP